MIWSVLSAPPLSVKMLQLKVHMAHVNWCTLIILRLVVYFLLWKHILMYVFFWLSGCIYGSSRFSLLVSFAIASYICQFLLNLQEVVYPFYGNTHTEANVCGMQTSHFYAEARGRHTYILYNIHMMSWVCAFVDLLIMCIPSNLEIIRQSCNAHPTDDVVLFTGTGSTGAIHKIIQVHILSQQIVGIYWRS